MRIPGLAMKVLVAAALLVSGCDARDPEQALRSRIQAAVAAAESRETGFFRDLIAEGFQDQRGNDRQALVNMIRGQFIINRRVEVISRIEEISVLGADAARTVISAGIVGSSGKPLALGGISADLYRIDLEWVLNGGEWRVIGARWSRLGGD